jgi:hypothetical protein
MMDAGLEQRSTSSSVVYARRHNRHPSPVAKKPLSWACDLAELADRILNAIDKGFRDIRREGEAENVATAGRLEAHTQSATAPSTLQRY